MDANLKPVLILGGLGVVGWFVYQKWFAVPSDEQASACSGQSDVFLATLALSVYQDPLYAQSGGTMDGYISSFLKAKGWTPETVPQGNRVQLGCMRAAAAKFPTVAAAQPLVVHDDVHVPVATVVPNPAAPSVLDTYYSKMVAAAKAAGEADSLTADQWNFYLTPVMGKPAPAPDAVFTQSGFDRNAPMTSAVYWAMIAPYLKTTQGLSGLGIYGGLGQLARAVR